MSDWSWEIDGWMIVIGALCAAAAALLGNFLVLRRMSLLGDAISHAVLPGLAAAFIFTGQRQGLVMFVGAAAVGVLTVLLTELARQYGRVDEGASIGIVFTGLFALGLILINLDAAKRVDLDASCVLYGSLELSVLDHVEIVGWSVPRVVIPLAAVFVLNAAFVFGLYRPLKVSTFDPQLAAAQGVRVGLIHYSLAAFVAITAVASFESVGNILVVAMFVVPPVTAWLLTDRLAVMIVLSVVVGVVAAVLGHLSAITVPTWFGGMLSLVIGGMNWFRAEAIVLPEIGKSNTAGMIAVMAGLLLLLAALFGPRKGILSRGFRSLRVALNILSEDVLAAIYRAELQGLTAVDTRTIRGNLLVSSLRARLVFMWLKWQNLVVESNQQLSLATDGRRLAQNIVRSHRLWEQYLASEAGLSDRELHQGAERFEHFTDKQLRDRLNAETNAPMLILTANQYHQKPSGASSFHFRVANYARTTPFAEPQSVPDLIKVARRGLWSQSILVAQFHKRYWLPLSPMIGERGPGGEGKCARIGGEQSGHRRCDWPEPFCKYNRNTSRIVPRTPHPPLPNCLSVFTNLLLLLLQQKASKVMKDYCNFKN